MSSRMLSGGFWPFLTASEAILSSWSGVATFRALAGSSGSARPYLALISLRKSSNCRRTRSPGGRMFRLLPEASSTRGVTKCSS